MECFVIGILAVVGYVSYLVIADQIDEAKRKREYEEWAHASSLDINQFDLNSRVEKLRSIEQRIDYLNKLERIELQKWTPEDPDNFSIFSWIPRRKTVPKKNSKKSRSRGIRKRNRGYRSRRRRY